MMVMCAVCNLSFVVHEKYTDAEGRIHCPKCKELIPDLKVKPFGSQNPDGAKTSD